MFSRVSGTLAINDQGCFTLDDRVLVVGKGSSVVEGGDSLEVADVGVVQVGSRTSGAGGLIDGPDDVQYFAEAMSLGDEVMSCQTDSKNPALTVLDPATP